MPDNHIKAKPKHTARSFVTCLRKNAISTQEVPHKGIARRMKMQNPVHHFSMLRNCIVLLAEFGRKVER
jgi:hypothetical protein